MPNKKKEVVYIKSYPVDSTIKFKSWKSTGYMVSIYLVAMSSKENPISETERLCTEERLEVLTRKTPIRTIVVENKKVGLIKAEEFAKSEGFLILGRNK